MTNLYEAPKTIKLIEAKNKIVVAMDWVEGDRRQCESRGIKFQYLRWTNSRDLLYNTVSILKNIVHLKHLRW